jgi:sulfur relay (sulfurtransferase) DsrC/TusE family protein
MGCVVSRESNQHLLKSKATKRTVSALLDAANDWKSTWAEFIDTMEKTQLNAAHWSQVRVILIRMKKYRVMRTFAEYLNNYLFTQRSYSFCHAPLLITKMNTSLC